MADRAPTLTSTQYRIPFGKGTAAIRLTVQEGLNREVPKIEFTARTGLVSFHATEGELALLIPALTEALEVIQAHELGDF